MLQSPPSSSHNPDQHSASKRPQPFLGCISEDFGSFHMSLQQLLQIVRQHIQMIQLCSRPVMDNDKIIQMYFDSPAPLFLGLKYQLLQLLRQMNLQQSERRIETHQFYSSSTPLNPSCDGTRKYWLVWLDHSNKELRAIVCPKGQSEPCTH